MFISQLFSHGVSAIATYSPHTHVSLISRDSETDSLSDPSFIPQSFNNSDIKDFGMLDEINNMPAQFTHGLIGVNQDLNWLLTAVLGLTLAGLTIATLVLRWIKMGNAHMRFLFTHSDKGSQRYWMKNQTSWWPSIKRHLLYAPFWRVRHNREIQLSSAISIGTLPSRFHSLLLIVYLACNVAYCLMLDWKHENSASVVADLRGRSGQLATINIIPTVLFALRNNPLIPLLRVSYDTFNLFHRWCARMVVVQTLVHTIAFIVNSVNAGGTQAFANSIRTSGSYAWGMVATVLFTVVLLITFSPLRHAFYETFVNVHRILVLFALIGVYLHIEKAGLPQLPYVRAVFALWAAEWVTRIYHIIYNNVSARTGLTKVVVEALPAEACRVTFQLARPWRFVPGAHVHVYLPTISGWSSHPFSVAWSETTTLQPALDLDLEKLPEYHNPNMDSVVDISAACSRNAPEMRIVTAEVDGRGMSRKDITTTVSVIMRARTGMTRALYDRAAASPTGLLLLKGGIEGPYGGHESLHSYGTVILFAGGVGITHCLSHLKHLLTLYEEGTCSTRRILLVWSVPNTEALEWVRPWMDQILRMEGRKDILRIQLFITKPRHQNEIRSNTGTVQMFPGRCNPNTIIDKEMSDRIGATAVAVCGPGSFADGVRAAARKKVQEGSVDFIEEAFTY